MPRNRMIKPEFWDDEKLATISRDARLTYIAMWNFSDDYGVIKGHWAWLKNNIYPYECDITIDIFKGWMLELEELGRIKPFKHKGERFYYLPNFLIHQKINRPTPNRQNPPPPLSFSEDSVRTHEPVTEENKIKRKEVNIYSPVIEYLNRKTGKAYRPSTDKTKKLISARFSDGFTLEDFNTVIDIKTEQWLGTEMEKYLRPETLFGTKFEGYLNECRTKSTKPRVMTPEEKAAKLA